MTRSSGLRSESAGLATPPLHFMVGRTISHPLMDLRRNRRAPGVSAGEKHGCDERSRSEQTCFSPAGDRQIADCSAGSLCHRRMRKATTSLRPLRLCGSKPGRIGGIGSPSEQSDAAPVTAMICVYLRDLRFLALCGWAILVSSCLRVCDVCVPSLCLCASVVRPASARARRRRHAQVWTEYLPVVCTPRG